MDDKTRHVWLIDDGERWWIVAETEEEARIYARDYEIGADYLPPYGEPGEWEREVTAEVVPDDREIPVTSVDDTPEQVRKDADDGAFPPGAHIDGRKVTATAGEWARHSKTGALIASTVY